MASYTSIPHSSKEEIPANEREAVVGLPTPTPTPTFTPPRLSPNFRSASVDKVEYWIPPEVRSSWTFAKSNLDEPVFAILFAYVVKIYKEHCNAFTINAIGRNETHSKQWQLMRNLLAIIWEKEIVDGRFAPGRATECYKIIVELLLIIHEMERDSIPTEQQCVEHESNWAETLESQRLQNGSKGIIDPESVEFERRPRPYKMTPRVLVSRQCTMPPQCPGGPRPESYGQRGAASSPLNLSPGTLETTKCRELHYRVHPESELPLQNIPNARGQLGGSSPATADSPITTPNTFECEYDLMMGISLPEAAMVTAAGFPYCPPNLPHPDKDLSASAGCLSGQPHKDSRFIEHTNQNSLVAPQPPRQLYPTFEHHTEGWSVGDDLVYSKPSLGAGLGRGPVHSTVQSLVHHTSEGAMIISNQAGPGCAEHQYEDLQLVETLFQQDFEAFVNYQNPPINTSSNAIWFF